MSRESSVECREAALRILDDVKDPEVPVLSVVELGIVRDVEIAGDDVTVVITPTYSGCPAMRTIEDDIVAALRAHGITRPAVRTVYAPAWTTDWISEAARAKLRVFGIAPPAPVAKGEGPAAGEERVGTLLVALERRRAPARCPFCGSTDTRLTAEFGATACKALHVCNACTQPFEEFKAI